MAAPAVTNRLIHLDMLRGLAALAVAVGHMRGFLLVDYGDLQSPGMAEKMLYFLTGFGHQAVIAFFALSGYLVGGKALKDMLSDAWSGPQYMVARLSRLWTVAIPALGLTLAWDLAGRALSGGAGYDGAYWGILSSGPSSARPADDSLGTLFANMLFLQTIAAPVYGTDGPLWSLANEFWYYVVFPLAASAVFTRRPVWRRLLAVIGAAAIVLLLPGNILLLGVIWVAGAIAYHMTTLAWARGIFSGTIYLGAAAACAAGAGALPRLYPVGGQDLLLGGAFALLLPALAAAPRWGGPYARVAKALSEVSYTLYATHFPFLAFVWFTALAPSQFSPGLAVLALAMGLLAATLLYASAIWWCFERNTARVRSAALGWVGVAPRARGAAPCR